MYQFSEVAREEYWRIRDAYTALDPDGDFDEAEWQKFFSERASDTLKREVQDADNAYRDARKRGIRI